MIVNNNLIWTADEYKAVADYKSNGYSKINVLLSNEVTQRELVGKFPVKQIVQSPEELRETIKKITLIYSAIKKNHTLNGKKSYKKTLFRGKRDDKIDYSFLSTSDKVRTAFEFTKSLDHFGGFGKLLVIESTNIPYINTGDVLPGGDNLDGDEPEILFLPCQIEELNQLELNEAFNIAKQQGERIPAEKLTLKKYSSTLCMKAVLKELDYSAEKTDLTIDDLCNMFPQYSQDITILREGKTETPAYKEAYARVKSFKNNCYTYIHQKFYEINQIIDSKKQNTRQSENNNSLEPIKDSETQNDEIQLSSNFEMQEISIGNTGEMYQITDKENNNEYYFKPAVSKNGEIRPYRAFIQEAAYNIQEIINPEASVKCNPTTINGMFGSIQEKIPVDIQATQAFKNYFDRGIGELSTDIICQILDEYLVDYCLCNYDSHASNFIIDETGRLRGIDKEQAFRYINEDSENDMSFSTNYNERYGENPAIYNTLFEEMKEGKISYKLLNTLKYRASRLSQFPDEEYAKIFEEYAQGKTKTPEEAESLLNRILDRKKNILQNIEDFSNEIYMAWYQKTSLQRRTRNILLSACADVALSDLATTKDAMKETLKEPTKESLEEPTK